MRKIILSATLLVAFIANAQKVYDFTGSQNPGDWAKQGGGGLLDDPNGVVPSEDGLVLEFRDSGLIYLTTTNPSEAAYVANSGDLMRITLVNNNTEVDVLGPLNDRNDGVNTGIQFYGVNNSITSAATKGTGAVQVITVPLTANYNNDSGTGTFNDTDNVANMERVGIRMGATAGLVGANPFLTQTSADAGNIIIKKIEILSAGTSAVNSYDFSTDNTLGFSAVAGGSVADGGSTIDFNTNGSSMFPRLEQNFFSVDATNKFLHIEVDSNLSDANLIGFRFITAEGAASVYPFETLNTGGASTTVEIPLTRDVWTGTITGWSILVRKDDPATTINTGLVKISSIIFDNNETLSTENNVFNELAIYLDPTNTNLTIAGVEDLLEVKLYDITGRLVIETATLINNQVNIGSLQSGVYLLSIKDANNNKIVKRFVKN